MNASKSETSSGFGPFHISKNRDCRRTCSHGDEIEITRRFESQINRLAWNYSRGNRHLQQDLAQEGLTGLVNAYRNYSRTGGASFATYADRHIRGRMKNFIRSECRHNCCVSWVEYQGAEADANDLGDESPFVTAHEAIEAVNQFTFAVDVQLLRQFLSLATSCFTRKQRFIFRLRFVHGLTVGEIAQETSVSAARVSQVLGEAVRKLQAAFIHN